MEKNEMKEMLLQFKEHKISKEELLKQMNGSVHIISNNQKKDQKKTVASMTATNDSDIAIIGMSCRFPFANDLDEYWNLIKNGENAIIEVPSNRFDVNKIFGDPYKEKNKTNCRWGGFLDQIDTFDPLFFQISPKEAELMDPQQRLFLMEAWRTFENAGYSAKSLEKMRCGVFAGHADGDYKIGLMEHNVPKDACYFMGNSGAILSARISYLLNLKGPSISLDTACSSSLVALHLACESLRSGECQMALVGGVSAFVSPQLYLLAGSAGMLSPDGQCKAFDDNANGFVPAEGVGCVLIKPLKQAIADKDKIYAVIKGSGLNQDGKSNGITAPNALSQTALEQEIYDRYQINPEEIGYIEAHGTGTILGDPIEVTALIDSFKKYTNKEHFCALGSVKTNIGHTQLAAGVASIIKAVLMLQHKELPPIVNFKKQNHHINLEHTPFYINQESKAWTCEKEGSRKVAISGFGFSGTNAHVVLQEYVQKPCMKEDGSKHYYPICLSAKSEKALLGELQELQNWIEKNKDELTIERISYSLCQYKSHFNIRTALVACSMEELSELLTKMKKHPEMVGMKDIKRMNKTAGKGKQYFEPRIDSIIQKLNQEQLTMEEEKEQVDYLAEFYKAGYYLNADLLYPNCSYERMDMPKYQFDMDRYWFSTDTVSQEQPHNTFVSSWKQHEFEIKLEKDTFFIQDHIVEGKNILPGVAYIEFARKAVEEATGKEVCAVKHIVWQKPVIVDHDLMSLYVQLQSEADRIKFKIISREGISTALHCQGSAYLKREDCSKRKVLNITRLKNKLQNEWNQEQHYHNFVVRNMRHGKSMQAIQKLYTGRNDALGYIELPEVIQSSRKDFVLHPAILDGALQTVIGVESAVLSDHNKIFLPFEIQKVTLYDMLPNKLYSYAVKTAEQEFTVWLTNLSGKVVAKLAGLRMRSVSMNIETKAKVNYLIPNWIPYDLEKPKGLLKKFLLIDAKQLKYYEAFSDGTETRKLIAEGAEQCHRLSLEAYDYIVYFADSDDKKEVCLEHGVYQFVTFLKEKLINTRNPVYLMYLYDRTSPYVEVYEAVSSLCKSVMLENANLVITTCGYEQPVSLYLIGKELSQRKKNVIQYIDKKRYIWQVEKQNVQEPDTGTVWKRNGVYVLTGGNGKVGSSIAHYLVSRYQAKVILLGRSIKDSYSETDAIESYGVDICDIEKLRAVCNQIKNRNGKITGVLHCAGIHKDSFLRNKSLENFQGVICAKVEGTESLMNCMEECEADFYVFFSSTTSISGTPGQCDYAYANGYLNAYANQLQKAGKNVISICWSFWENGGMQISAQDKQFMKETVGMEGITIQEGLDMLAISLKEGKNTIIPLKGNADKFLQYLTKTCTIARNHTIVKSVLTCVKDKGEKALNQNLYRKVKKIVYSQIEKLIHISLDKIKEEHDFTDYGFDSILLTSLANELNEELHIDLMPTVFFDKSCIREFIQYLCDEYLAKRAEEEVQPESNQEVEDMWIEDVSQEENVQENIYDENAHDENVYDENHLEADYPCKMKSCTPEDNAVAIIGMAGVMPQCASLEEFFAKLETETDFITEIPKDRWDWREAGKEDMRWGSFMNDIDMFDNEFFSISPREAELMDPQQRILLECVWHTIEDAGYKASELRGSNMGVFVGVSTMDYTDLSKKNNIPVSGYTSTGRAHSVLVNRVSYLYDFHGASEPVDTACSSSLIAIIRGVKSIQSGDCDTVIAGGVNVIASDDLYAAFSKSGMLAKDGKCKPFDENANGYVRGEGVGTVFLKSLSKAERDGDHIYAVIKGCGINHGGHASSLTAPNATAQANLIVNTYQKANINPLDVTYIEAHGTGTKLGDPVEIDGLKKAFRKLYEMNHITNFEEGYCNVGSVKSNIGHLESAAGIASVFKVLLSMQKKRLPASIHINKLNPYLDLKDSPFRIIQETKDWTVPEGKKRMAGISCFGYGGANANLVLEQYEAQNIQPNEIEENRLFIYSAKNEEQLKVYVKEHIQYLQDKKQDNTFSLEPYAYVLQTGRESMEERLALPAKDVDQLLVLLQEYLDGKEKASHYTGNKQSNSMFKVLNESTSWSEYERKIYTSKDYNTIAVLWVNGVDLDFRKLYEGRRPGKISIPKYPFAKTRYWLPIEDSVSSETLKKKLHPLIDDNVSTMDKILFRKSLSQSDFFIHDHNIQGSTILPGVAYLEMVRAAGELAQQSDIKMIEDVIWAAPITVKDKEKDSFVELSKVNGKIHYKVYYNEYGKSVVASQGKLLTLLDAEDSLPVAYPIGELKNQLKNAIGHEEAYQYFAKLGFQYGDTFKCIDYIQSSHTEALGRYEIPKNQGMQWKTEGFQLIIPAMDAALQTIMGTGSSSQDGSEKQFIPFALKRLCIFGEIPMSGYAYIRLHSQNEDGSVRKFDISILDETGDEKVRFEQFTSRALEGNVDYDNTSIKPLYYKNKWEEKQGSLTAMADTKQKLAIVFGNEIQGKQYREALQEYNMEDVVVVQDACQYQKMSASTYSIRPAEYADYESLFIGLDLTDYSEIIIYHAFAADEILMNTLSMQERLEYGFLSMSCLIKALLNQKFRCAVKIGYVYARRQNFLQPENEMVSGMCKSVPYLNHKCAITTIAADLSVQDKTMINRIILELLAKEASEPKQIWLNEKGRFQKNIIKVTIAKCNALTCFQAGDYVLITGGLGQLGRMFATYLAEQKVNVILVGRRPEESEADWLNTIRSIVDVIYIQSNITLYEETLRVYNICKEKGVSIKGILHIAGIAGKHTIDSVSIEEYQKPLLAKLYGTVNLNRVFRKEPLKCVVYFSSVASQMGDYGGCAYACANAFLNTYAQVRNELVKKHYVSGNTYAIQWGIWSDGSMKLPVGDEEQYFNTTGMMPISKEHGLEMFRNITSQGAYSIIAVTGNEARVDRLLELSKPVEKPEVQNSVKVQPEKNSIPTKKKAIKKQLVKHPVKKAVSSFDMKQKTKDYLRSVIANAVKTKESNVGDDTTFEKLGIESFMIMDIHDVLEKNFEGLSRTLFFEYYTLSELVDYFLEEHKEELIKMFHQDVEDETEEYEEVEAEVEETDKNITEKTEVTLDLSVTGKVDIQEREKDVQDIAIIGMSGRYPMSESIETLYENLKAGKDCIEEIPLERFDYRKFYDKKGGKGKITCKWGGFIKDADKFDEEFFGIVPKVASMMDPQERIMLETAWQAIEDSGYTPEELTSSSGRTRDNDVGVFVGMMYDDYKVIETQELMNHNYDSLTEYWNSPIANRISFMFDFRGPSYVVDSACSSSLTTLHMACDSIRNGQCKYAIAGGVSLSLHPSKFLRLTDFGMSSPTGSCKSFGEGADGYVPGEGVGAVLLKPLAQAKKDGDNIYAVIKGSSVNHGGKANGFTVPNPNAQSDVIVHALESCNIDARSISYIETHGTGTALGDPIEIRGLTKAFHTKEKQFCKIGSIKSNMGHCEGAAGIAAVTKVALQLKYKQLFPSLHAKVENKLIDFENSPFVIQKELEDWKQPVVESDGKQITFPRRAGISSFGAGGSNVHVIMEEYMQNEKENATRNENELLFISAKDKEAFDITLRNWVKYLDTTEEKLHNISYTSVVGRVARRYRLAFVAATKEDAKQQLLNYLECNKETQNLFTGIVKMEQENAEVTVEYANDTKSCALQSLAQIWTKGYVLEYQKLFDGEKNFRVSIPRHPLKKNRHWIKITYDSNEISSFSKNESPTEVPDMVQAEQASISELTKDEPVEAVKEDLSDSANINDLVADYLRQILSDVTQIQKEKIDDEREFSEYGIDSIGITSFGNQIIKDFPDVSETALFAYQTILDLAEYLCESYEDEVQEFFGEKLLQRKQVKEALPRQTKLLNISEIMTVGSAQKNPNECKHDSILEKDVAIIGISAKIPGCGNLDEFWDNLCNKKSFSKKICRWDMSEYYDEEIGKNGKTYCQYGSFLDDIDAFDPQFFHIAKAEADTIDPQERMFLQEAWNAVVNAGYTKESMDRNTGVFVGVTTSSYRYVGYEESLKGMPAHTSTSFASIANRVSYTLDLRGPSIPVDSMCSSTVAAIHMACQEIKSGHCNMAIAGGVNLYSHPMAMVNLSKLKLLSNDDKTRSFCEGGLGFVPGEAIGAIVLKSLEAAKRDGDYIYAVIKGSAAGHIGRTNAYFSQNPIRQAEIIEQAIKDADVPKESISYIETATTGTEINDSIEIESLKKVFRNKEMQEHSIAIGSVKPNVGHAESASGIDQLMKVLMQLKHKQLAPTKLNGTWNKKISLEHSSLYLADHVEEWKEKQVAGEAYPRRAAINSLGAGGYLAHIILEEPEAQTQEKDEPENETICVPVSSNTKRGLIRNVKNLAGFIEKNPSVSLHAIAYNLRENRQDYTYRAAFLSDNKDTLCQNMKQFINGNYDQIDIVTNLERGKEYPVNNTDTSNTTAYEWVIGKHVNWPESEKKYGKIPLPGYSFEKVHCWSDKAKNFEEIEMTIAMGNEKISQFWNGLLLKYFNDTDILKKHDSKEQETVVSSLLKLMMNHKLIQEEQNALKMTDTCKDEVIQTMLSNPERRLEFLSRAFPELEGHLKFLLQLENKLEEIFQGKVTIDRFLMEEETTYSVIQNETRFDQMIFFYYQELFDELLRDRIGTITILDDNTFSSNVAERLVEMCKQYNLSVVFYLYDEIGSIAKIKKELLAKQGVIADIITKESREELGKAVDFILAGRMEFTMKDTKADAMYIRYLPALLEYYLITYQIIQPTLDIQPFLSITPDKHLIIQTAEDLQKENIDSIDEDVRMYMASELGVSKTDIDVHISLAEYGMNSILMARFYSHLVENYGDIVNPADVLEAKDANQIIELLKAKTRHGENTEEEKILSKSEVYGNETVENYFTTSRGNVYEVTVEGEGEPLFILTALAFIPNVWKYQKEHWKHKYKMIFLCLPGHGNSEFNGQQIAFSDIVNDIKEILDSLMLDCVSMIGWCMAGNILQKFTALYPERVKKVCFVCTTPEDASIRGVSSNDLKEYSENPLKTYELEFMNIYGGDESKQKQIQEYMKLIHDSHCQVDPIALLCYINELFKFDIKKEIQTNLKIPVLIIAGRWDITYPADQVERLKGVYPDAEFEIFEYSGHMPFISEKDKFNQLIEQFLLSE